MLTSLRQQSAEHDRGASLLARLTERIHARTRDVAVVSRLDIGSPADLLLKAASGAGLVVVGGTHGRVSDALGGSVGAHVAAHHSGPVMVARMPTWPPGPSFATCPVVVGVDGCPGAAVDFGMQEARLHGCELVLLHAADDGSDFPAGDRPGRRCDRSSTEHRRPGPGVPSPMRPCAPRLWSSVAGGTVVCPFCCSGRSANA